MKYSIYFAFWLILSCKIDTASNRNYFDKSRIYKLCLDPKIGSRYHYNILNDAEISFKFDGGRHKDMNKSSIGIYCQIAKDSFGNFVAGMEFDKLHFYSKTSGNVVDLDADDSNGSFDPLARMLRILKGAKVSMTLNSKGESGGIAGYKELGERIFSEVGFSTEDARNLAKQEWDNFIGSEIIESNLDVLFKIFPDSAVHIGDTWKVNNSRNGFGIRNIYQLKLVDDNLAIIEAEGEISSDNGTSAVGNLNLLPGKLKGGERAEYEIDSKTGILLNAKVKTSVDGVISTMGFDVPVTVETSIRIDGRRVE